MRFNFRKMCIFSTRILTTTFILLFSEVYGKIVVLLNFFIGPQLLQNEEEQTNNNKNAKHHHHPQTVKK